MRLIDADALKQHIAFYGIVGTGYSDDERVTDVWSMIDEAPTIQLAAQTVPTWHDLLKNPDDLPTGGQHVLVAYDYDSETGKYWDCDIGEYWSCRDSSGNVEGWGNTPAKVIAWKEFD